MRLSRTLALLALTAVPAAWWLGPPDLAALSEPGPVGALALLGAFALGPLVALPGMGLVALVGATFDPVTGTALSTAGALLYVTTPFLTARRLREPPGPSSASSWRGRLLARVDRHPVLVVAALRLVGHLSAPLSVALSLTGMRFRDYLLGSALGLVLPIGGVLYGLSTISGIFR